MIDPRTPCLIGVAQHTVRGGSSPEPLELWAEVCRGAADDTGIGARALAAADSVQIVYCQAWPYDDPVGRLADALGISPRHHLYSGIGGTTPQVLVQDAAASILAGDYDVAVIAGAEALETVRQAKKAGLRLPWSHRDPEKKPFPFEAPFHPAEIAHNVFQAWLTFPVFDIARRARLGISPQAYRQALGDLLAPMTEVAAANPYAWFPVARSADELITATATNRMVGYPYTKYMVSVMDVDMAAAVIVASHAKADELGIPADRRVYLRGWSYATDPVYLAEHPDMSSSPAMRFASRTALHGAGVDIDDIAHLDLYSCFGSSVNLACDALGIDPDRGITVTGGLPFSGGAGSNYMLHSIAAMAEVLRDDAGSVGLVSGVGMHMTKHVFGVYSTTPGSVSPPPPSPAPEASPITATYQGPATVVTYTVAHARGGEPDWGLIVADLPDATRAYGRVEDPALLTAMEAEEWVGAAVHLAPGDNAVNLVKA